LGPRVDNRNNISYTAGRADRDLWPILGTLLLIVFVITFAMIVWQGRQASHPSGHKTPTDRIALIAASPQPTRASEPTPEPTPTPVPSVQPQLVNTGAIPQNAPTAPPARTTAPPTARPTPTPKPPATHYPPTAILKTIPGGLKGAQITADGSFSWDATGIASYYFNWSDGITSGPQSSPVAAHTYSGPGTYRIWLTVVNNVGLASSTSVDVTVG
jgi:PKD domain-containing protein